MDDSRKRIAELEAQIREEKKRLREQTRQPRDEPGGLLYWEIGKRVREAREALGISQAELAMHVGVVRTSIVNIEGGRQRLPITMLYDIADALGVQATQLLPRNEDV